LASLSDKEKKRQEVIFELIQTERDYVRDLDIIFSVEFFCFFSLFFLINTICLAIL